MKLFDVIDLQLFASSAAAAYDGVATNVQTTGMNASGNDVSPTMKTFYRTALLENARAKHYFAQFGQKQPLPKNGGKTVEWRKFNSFSKALTPLTEGVTPDGNKIDMEKITAEIAQYGDYTTISDRLQLEAVDPIISLAMEEHGAQAGDTMDTLIRNAVVAGKHVFYAGNKGSRSALTSSDVLTPQLIDRVYTHLKKMKAPTINGNYIAIVHPSVAYDLRENSAWIEVHKYAQPGEIFNGEIGMLHNVRFIEDTEQKIWQGGSGGAAVYATTFFGKDAYGIVEPTAESMEIIVKQLGSAGTADPLNQRSTVGWKASTATKILYEERIARVESGSFFSDTDLEN